MHKKVCIGLPNMGLQVWLITSKQTDPDLELKKSPLAGLKYKALHNIQVLQTIL